MCNVIIAGSKHDLIVKCGIDWMKLNDVNMEEYDSKTNTEYVKNHYGDGNLLPGAPSCNFKGKKVPAFVTFSEGGGSIDGF